MGGLMLDTLEIDYRLDEYTNEAKGIAWDTCHKIYVLMDDEQVALQRSYGYGDEPDPDSLITSEQMTGDEMRKQVMEWYRNSCGLKFISAVSTNPKFGNDGWVHIVSQFENDEDDEDEDY
jgi:hypothetical protein